MKRLALIVMLIASPVAAQQFDPPVVTDAMNNSVAEAVLHSNTDKAIRALADAYRGLLAENAKLRADLEAAKKPEAKAE